MKALIISIDNESSLKKLIAFAKKLRLRTKLVEADDAVQEHDDWMKLGMQNLAKAYGNDEPDIDNLAVKEPNPEYNPWKQGAL
ncbi:MAG TPA: hypothetical protein VI757_12000 [Bacteroidia bacterium]|nr:hypothetical protein [Bacteroidia bacterium]